MTFKKRTAAAVGILLLIGLITASGIFIFNFGRSRETSIKRPKDRYRGEIESYRSPLDTDGDGIDDQSDILESALTYVATKPQYESRYYASGYPDDGYGVCTDVVAFALRGAGYDLMTDVETDVMRFPDEYAIEYPDEKIDFRRVRNLLIYFSHTAEQLTTDPKEIEAWQGGDIVVFDGHIGIVSDRRNRRGVPYVIHHGSPSQRAYEQDILTKREIVAHFRIN